MDNNFRFVEFFSIVRAARICACSSRTSPSPRRCTTCSRARTSASARRSRGSRSSPSSSRSPRSRSPTSACSICARSATRSRCGCRARARTTSSGGRSTRPSAPSTRRSLRPTTCFVRSPLDWWLDADLHVNRTQIADDAATGALGKKPLQRPPAFSGVGEPLDADALVGSPRGRCDDGVGGGAFLEGDALSMSFFLSDRRAPLEC